MAIKRSILVTGAVAAVALAVAVPLATQGTPAKPAATAKHHELTLTAVNWVATQGGGKQAASTTDYLAYAAFAGGYQVVEADTNSDTIIGTISDDTGEGVAVTPDDSTVYIADTGQYYVIAYNVATKSSADIEVGPYPQDVAISPNGSLVYATVTGGDTGPGGSDEVAVISTATNTVTGDIRVGTAPRQVVFSPDGTRAYVTTEDGIYVIDVATSSVINVFRGPFPGPSGFGNQLGPQGIAVSADGKTLYVADPAANQVWELSASLGVPLGIATVGNEPYAVTPVGDSLYVANMNDDTVSVVSTLTGKATSTIAVGRLPMSIAATPDGSQVWVGNGLSGSVSVISVASGTVVATLGGGPGTSTLDAAPLGITFVPAP
jgi:YVTN family beta-propeller protein